MRTVILSPACGIKWDCYFVCYFRHGTFKFLQCSSMPIYFFSVKIVVPIWDSFEILPPSRLSGLHLPDENQQVKTATVRWLLYENLRIEIFSLKWWNEYKLDFIHYFPIEPFKLLALLINISRVFADGVVVNGQFSYLYLSDGIPQIPTAVAEV